MISADGEMHRRSSPLPRKVTVIPTALTRTASGVYSSTPLLPSITASLLPLSSMQGALSTGGIDGTRRRLPGLGSLLFSDIKSPIYFMSRGAYILSVTSDMSKLLFRIRNITPLLIVVIGAPFAVIYSDECSEGIGKGIGFCTGVLVPSLFIFMILTAFLIKSGGAALISRPFGWPARMMGLPRESMAAVLPAMIGGYPIGAGCAALLYEGGQLSESEAEKTAVIAVAAGPGFIMNYVGRSLLNSPQAGNILLISQIIAVLLTGIIAGRLIPCSPPPRRREPVAGTAGAFVSSVRSAADATFAMCAMVVLFSAVIEVVSAVADSGAADIISAFLEVTTGCNRLSGHVPLYVTAFFIGFGGLSVHWQIFASLGKVRVRRWLFFLFRIIEGIICMAATYIFLMITPIQTAVFSSSDALLSGDSSATMAGSGALILASLCFIASVSSKIRRLRICAE